MSANIYTILNLTFSFEIPYAMVSIPYAKHFFGSRMNGENRAQTPDSMVTIIELVSYNCLAQTLEGCGIVSSQSLSCKEPIHQQGLSSCSLMLQHVEHLNSVSKGMYRYMLKYIVHHNYLLMEHYTGCWKEKLKTILYQSNLQIHENIKWII